MTEANPVAAALPNGEYAIAWNDFDGDTSDLGIALRKVRADGELGALRAANAGTQFSQSDADLLWTGDQLVAAWVDYADPASAPDLRYRLFDAELNPLSDDLSLAATGLPEADVALTPFNGGFAAAYREGAADGQENLVVWVADKTFRVGPVLGGPIDDRPALVALDATHLLLAFSTGMDPTATGIYNVSRIRYSLIDVTSNAAPTHQALDPQDDVLSLETATAQLNPSLAPGKDGCYLAWRSEARPGDAAGDEVWLKLLRWSSGATPQLDTHIAETLVPRTSEASLGDQRRPELAHVDLPPDGALAVAWDDYSHSQGMDSGDPDVVVHYAPLHARDVARPLTFNESWKGTNGAQWPAYWTKAVNAGGSLTVDIQKNEGRTVGAPTGTGFVYVNDRTATNLEMVSKIRFNLNGTTAGLLARIDPVTKSYLAARFSTAVGDPYLRVFASVDDQVVEIANTALPYVFSYWAQNLDFYLKFRVVTDSLGTTLSAKFWLVDVPEPASWGVVGLLPTNLVSTSPLYAAKTRLGNAAGFFGVYSAAGISNRSATFDDLAVTYFEGAQLGDPTHESEPLAPLLRRPPDYGTCTSAAKCDEEEGTCSAADQCESGSCTGSLSDLLGLGSHAKTCVAAHCSNNVLDADEVRADCGGPDCVPCACTALTPGVTAYCSPSCLCGVGDADCTSDTGCLPGLRCAPDKGYRYGWAQGVDACVPQHCQDRVQDADELGPDWGGSCGSVQCFSSPNGGYNHCTVSCPCGKAEGDCTYNDQCQTGMVCIAGTTFGKAFNVCVKAHCANTVKDADETAKNCGGADCAPCP